MTRPDARIVLDDRFTCRIRDGAGPPLLWLHGYTLDSGVWSALWDRLPGYGHVGVDLPGHGGSPPPEPGEDLAGLARRLGAAVTRLGVRDIVALSFGTILAVELAARVPDAVRTLVLAAPTLGGGPQDPGTRARYRAMLRTHERSGPGPPVAQVWLHPDTEVFRHARRRPALWHLLRSTVEGHRWDELSDGGMQRLTSAPQGDALLGRITARTLVVLGEHELPVFTATGTRIVAAVPDARRAVVPDTGHLCLLEEPEAAAALVHAHVGAGRAV